MPIGKDFSMESHDKKCGEFSCRLYKNWKSEIKLQCYCGDNNLYTGEAYFRVNGPKMALHLESNYMYYVDLQQLAVCLRCEFEPVNLSMEIHQMM